MVYQEIIDHSGNENIIRAVITDFYNHAFTDMIIGHFFVNKDKNELIDKQTIFATQLLGGPKSQNSSPPNKPLKTVHQKLPIRNAHFNRRQVIFKEVLAKHPIAPDHADYWLTAEEKLRPLIVSAKCPKQAPRSRPKQS